MATIVAAPDTTASESRRTRRWAPAEGWITVPLLLCLTLLMANGMAGIEAQDRRAVLIPLAAGAVIVGLLLAKSRTFDALAHLLSFIMAAVGSLLLTASRYGELRGSWREVALTLEARVEDLVRMLIAGSQMTSDHLLTLTGMIVWLVSYSSAWMMYRRSWSGLATIFPGAVLLASLALDRSEPTRSVYVYFVVALALNARHAAYRRERDWLRARIPAPMGLGPRFLAAGAWLALIATALGTTVPAHAPENLVEQVAERAERYWEGAAELYERLAPGGDNSRGASYAEFPDSFEVGGPLSLTDEPVAVLRAERSNYLAARRYDRYDGKGWESAVDDTYRMPGEKSERAKPVGYRPAQRVALSESVRVARIEELAQIELLQDTKGMLLTIDTYAGANLATEAIVGWRQFEDLQIDVHDFDPRLVPVDLYNLIAKLQEANVQPSPDGSEPIISNPNLAAEIEEIRGRLERDYPVYTSLSLVDGRLILTVSGRLPNYDDIEAVVSSEGSPGRYLVSGLASVASPDDLRNAGQEYPAYVRERYLQLPDSVTARTRELALAVVSEAGATNAFDQMIALQDHLRSSQYIYDIADGWLPEDGQDQVDAFLFERRIGRCEHFATAMVVMARTLGVPARLVSGYHHGAFDPVYQGFVSRADQAHTWVEVYFPRYGWIPFEPTPSRPELQYGDEPMTSLPTPEPTPEPEPTPTPEPTEAATPSPVPQEPTASTNETTPSGGSGDRWPWLVGLVAALIVVGGGTLAVAWIWGLRGLSPAAALYARALRIGRFWGVRMTATMTPHEFATELARRAPVPGVAARRVSELYAAEQYGRQTLSPTDTQSGWRAWRALRGSILRWRPWRRGRPRLSEGREAKGD